MLSLAREALSEAAGGEEDRKVIAHVFSNAGFLFSGTCLAREAEGQEEQQRQQPRGPPLLLLRSRLRGVIFDSCPARVDEDMALRGISAAARGVPAAKAAAAAAAGAAGKGEPSTSASSSSSPHSILSPPIPHPAPQSSTSLRDSALKLALRAFLRSGPIERAMEAAWRAWEGPPPPPFSGGGGGGSGGRSGEENGAFPPPPPPSCPRVYAYSLTDALIPPESVEEVAAAAAARAEGKREEEEEEESRRGGSSSASSASSAASAAASPPLLPAVSLRVFDSPHCEHLRWHPREYLELMESFSRAVEEEEGGGGGEDEEKGKGEGAILQV